MELFVSFSEIMEYFKRNIRRFIIIIALIGIVFSLMPLKFLQPEYSASTTIVVSCVVPETAMTDYRLQYTSILNSRVQTGVAMASGTDIVTQTVQKLNAEKNVPITEKDVLSIAGVQTGTGPVIKITASTSDAALASQISDTAAQVITEKLTTAFPSPELTAVISDKAIPQKAQSKKSSVLKAGIIGLIIGFILCVCFGIAVVLMDKTIRNSYYVSEALKTKLLGIVPNKGSEEKILDSYRKLRAAAINQAGEGKSFLVTNVSEKNGAPGVAVGFASAIARTGKTVLIIDADLRTHEIAKALNVTFEKSLADVLSGDCPPAQAVYSTAENGLSMIAGAESSEEKLTDLLASDQFRKLIQDLAPRYDKIVVSTPSEVRYPDADNIAKLFSAVIMVAMYGSTPYQEFKESFQRLRTAGGNIIGFVTTNV
jgi:polysaccharide biosynthesis transport protein